MVEVDPASEADSPYSHNSRNEGQLSTKAVGALQLGEQQSQF